MEDEVDAILKKLEEMEVVQVRMEQKLDALQAELDNLKKEHTKLTEENLKIKKYTIEQDERINLLEREIRKDKLIIQGIPDLENEVDSQLKEKINTMEDKVDSILKKLEEMEVVQVRMEQKLDALQAELDNLKKEHTKLTEENLKIKKYTIEQDERINLLEREIRKDKLII
ncbi:hypothetical protein RN001_009036 [Aquatica leii]|uniref:Uncharacterized protein n=1 Tax=Aquatica leii TaxID=1421715 RepID=A0AAN7Q244_9COLE|nr:hypothetical protein RN001_009036 [Aquatica leii]